MYIVPSLFEPFLYTSPIPGHCNVWKRSNLTYLGIILWVIQAHPPIVDNYSFVVRPSPARNIKSAKEVQNFEQGGPNKRKAGLNLIQSFDTHGNETPYGLNPPPRFLNFLREEREHRIDFVSTESISILWCKHNNVNIKYGWL